MAKKKDKKKTNRGEGLSPKLYEGLSKSRMAKKSGGNRLVLKKGDTATVQFLELPKKMKEFDVHSFQDGNRWIYVPCAGDNCPLCDDDDNDVSKTSYRFCCNVYSFRDKKVLILEGPKDLAGRIMFRYLKRKKTFLDRTWDVSKFDTTPVSYDVESADDKPVKTTTLKPLDLNDYVKGEMKRYYGDELPSGGKRSALDDDDDESEDDEYDEDELDDMEPSEVRRIAKSMGIKLVDKEGDKRKKSALIRLILKKQG